MKHKKLSKKIVAVMLGGAVLVSNLLLPFTAAAAAKDGTVTVTSKGELLTGFSSSSFIFEEKGIPGTYDIHAAEEIKNESDIVIYEKDAYVKTVKTDASGSITDTLKAGKYYSVEQETSPYVSVDAEKHEFEIKEGETTNVAYTHTGKRISLTVEGPAKGITYALYVANDLRNESGTVIANKDSMIMSQTAGENGKVVFADLPTNVYSSAAPAYYVKQTAVPPGYFLSSEKIIFDGNDNATKEFSAKVKTVTFQSVNENGNALAGVKYSLQDEDGNEIANWKSGKAVHKITALGMDKTYRVIVTKPAEGYATPEPLEFIADSSELQTVILRNDPTIIDFSIWDSTDNAAINGAAFEVQKADGTVVTSFSATKDVTEVRHVPVGYYLMVQTKATKGYVKMQPFAFEVTDSNLHQPLQCENSRTKGYIEILLLSSINRDPLQNAEFELRDKNGDLVEKLTTDQNGHVQSSYMDIAMFKDGKYVTPLPYTLKQIKSADGFYTDTAEYTIMYDYLDGDTESVYQTLTIPNMAKAGEEQRLKKVAKLNPEEEEAEVVRTGDDANIVGYIAMCVLALCIIRIIYKFKKQKK